MYFKLPDLLYPRRCAVCDGLLGIKEQYVCAKCAADVSPCTDSRCVICGRFTKKKKNIICEECRQIQHAFDIAFAPFAYEGKIRSSLLRFKYNARPEYAAFFADEIFKSSQKLILSMKADMIIHVPAHASRIRERGYDQAYLIAKRLSVLTGIPCAKKILIRRKKTPALSKLGAKERRAAVRGAFDLTAQPPKKIILVDDIFTTGATADEISALLKMSGCREICVLTAAAANLAC